MNQQRLFKPLSGIRSETTKAAEEKEAQLFKKPSEDVGSSSMTLKNPPIEGEELDELLDEIGDTLNSFRPPAKREKYSKDRKKGGSVRVL